MKKARKLVTCSVCGVEFLAYPSTKFCPMHEREKRLEKRKDARAYYKKKGWCYDCGKPVEPGKTRCSNCLEKHRRYYRDRCFKEGRPVNPQKTFVLSPTGKDGFDYCLTVKEKA